MALLALLFACFEGSPEAPGSPPGAASGSCVVCHEAAPAGGHAALPCGSCHLGNPAAADAESAHRGLEREPGALDSADRTCGVCHPEELARVRTLPMTTGRGLVGVDRFVFGELSTPDTEQTLAEVLATSTPSPAEDHLRRLCAGCHLGTRRDNRDDAVTGGSGCSACHAGAVVGGHSTVDSRVPDSRCAGCHSRSSRISLTYAGLVEAEEGDLLPDGRHTRPTTPDVHAAAGLACIDCHVHTELMGDGVSRAHQEAQVEVRCESCHGAAPAAVNLEDPVTLRLPHTNVVATGTRGTPLWNVRADGVLVGKLDGREHPISKVEEGHAGPGHTRLACAACHAAVGPTCVSCHTSFDGAGSQWDFGLASEASGRWVEAGSKEILASPALGVGPDDQIRPAIPGMIGSIAGAEVRRFVLLDPHATRRLSRSCVDCHTAPAALGLGTGALDVATFRFTPATSVPGAPGLAADGWTALGAPTPGLGTRVGVRSLNTAEQRRILRVGVCLGCHEGARVAPWSPVPARPAACTAGAGWWDAP